jgi:DNA-binding NarL/FixJ family response regulator
VKRLLLIAGGALEAEALRRALRYVPDCQVIGFADVSRPCGWTIRDARPDVILVNDGGVSTVTLARLREAREGAPEATIVCRTSHLEAGWPQAAADAGADATIATSVDAARMAVLVREIAAGTVFHTPRPQAGAAKDIASNLTARELEILQLMAAGATNSMVAAQLWVTEQTVKFHLSNVYRKLGVANRTEAAHYAHTHGLLNKPAARPGDRAERPAAAVAA